GMPVQGAVSPASLHEVYGRARDGVLRAIHGFATSVFGIPEDIAYDDMRGEHEFMCRYLLERPEHQAESKLLQIIWRTADEAVSGPVINAAAAGHRRALEDLPPLDQRNERRAQIAIAVRDARTIINGVLVPGIEQLKPKVSEALGCELLGEDVV